MAKEKEQQREEENGAMAKGGMERQVMDSEERGRMKERMHRTV